MNKSRPQHSQQNPPLLPITMPQANNASGNQPSVGVTSSTSTPPVHNRSNRESAEHLQVASGDGTAAVPSSWPSTAAAAASSTSRQSQTRKVLQTVVTGRPLLLRRVGKKLRFRSDESAAASQEYMISSSSSSNNNNNHRSSPINNTAPTSNLDVSGVFPPEYGGGAATGSPPYLGPQTHNMSSPKHKHYGSLSSLWFRDQPTADGGPASPAHGQHQPNDPLSPMYPSQVHREHSSPSQPLHLPRDDDSTKVAVQALERHLRMSLCLLCAYLLGVFHGGGVLVITKIVEYTIVAWCTCLLILLRARCTTSGRRHLAPQQPSMTQPLPYQYSPQFHQQYVDTARVPFQPYETEADVERDEEVVPLLHEDDVITADETQVQQNENILPNAPLEAEGSSQLARSISSTTSKTGGRSCVVVVEPEEIATLPSNLSQDQTIEVVPASPSDVTIPPLCDMPHPSLEPFLIMDANNVMRVTPNDLPQPYPLSNEYFDGSMIAMIRTPSIESTNNSQHSGLDLHTRNRAASHYFSNKLRRFEFQFQIKLKKLPSGRVFFGCQLDEPVKVGVIQRAFVSAAMTFVRANNPNFHYSFGSSSPSGDPSLGEKPIMAFPIEEGMNRVVATPPNEMPPKLGDEIPEDAESMKKRRKGIEWNLHDTYTMSVWSAYVDFLDWKCVNLPGIRPFRLDGVIGRQAIAVLLYEDGGAGLRKPILQLELSNLDKNVVGPYALRWLTTHATPPAPPQARKVESLTALEEEEPSSYIVEAEDATDLIEEEMFAQLGEGIYVESGDVITLRESKPSTHSTSGDVDRSCFVTYSGGFCVLQEHASASIVIEKVGRSRRGTKQSKLIKSGDSVMFKLLIQGNDGVETRYLSTHRGWWLKWVANSPLKNGVFTIHTHESECSSEEDGDDDDGEVPGRPEETQQSYLTWGNTFILRHKRWSKYQVGVASSGSATYGGRLLGLYSSKNSYDDDFGQIDESDMPIDAGGADQFNAARRLKEWMRPLQLRAFEVASPSTPPANVTPLKAASSRDDSVEPNDSSGEPKTSFSMDGLRADVPVWMELMNRKDRVCQLSYVVRVSPQEHFSGSERHGDDSPGSEAYFRLRSGRQLSRIMRVGLEWTNCVSSSPRKKRSLGTDSTEAGMTTSVKPTMSSQDRASDDGSLSPKKVQSPDELVGERDDVLLPSLASMEDQDDSSVMVCDSSSTGSEDSADDFADEDEPFQGGDVDIGASSSLEPGNRRIRRSRKGRKFIGKIAKSVKSKTASTGKTVVRTSMKVGKGTVNAGKAMIAPRPKQPPLHEPKAAVGASRGMQKRKERDLSVSVSRSMRRLEKRAHRTRSEAPSVLAGELSAPEQSCRTVSSMLSRMSSLSATDPLVTQFSSLLSNEVGYNSEQDNWFLNGGAMQVGVVPRDTSSELLYGGLVARCLWESHWREEWCGIYASSVSFYSPLTATPCLDLSMEDIQTVRELNTICLNPLPGLLLLALETDWMCHYVAFRSEEARSNFKMHVENVLSQRLQTKERAPTTADDSVVLWQARFWQGFKSSIKSTEGKWASVLSGNKLKHRLVLNSRRMVFDLPRVYEGPDVFVERLLSSALSLSQLSHLKHHPELLVAFLDAASQLRHLRLQDLDLSSALAFCVFVNIYHCLLQHALLLTVNGPLHKRSFGHFMRTSCYEIGGDVFSLAELHACVIRGNMSRPVTSKPPAVDVPKKSNSYRFYALGYTNPRINFFLNTGETVSPRELHILSPAHFLSQLNEQSTEYLRRNVTVDVSKRTVVLPRVCDVYRHDFVPDGTINAAHACLRYCLSFLKAELATGIRAMLENEAPVVIKFQAPCENYHTTLCLKESIPTPE